MWPMCVSVVLRVTEAARGEILSARAGLSVKRFRLLVAVLSLFLVTLDPVSGQSSPTTDGAATEAAQGGRSGAEPSYRVLLLYSESRLTPSVVRMDQALRSTLEARSPRPVHFYTEFLDLNSIRGSMLEDELVRLLRLKYSQRPIDLIVAQGQLTVPFVLQNRADLFSNPPVVFVGVESSTFANLSSESVITGTWRLRGWGDSLEELARRLHPRIRRAVVVVGVSTAERLWADAARQQLPAHAGPVEITYFIGSSSEEILETIAALPRDAVVLAGPFLRDETGRDFMSTTFISKMVAVAHVPVYGLTDGVLGNRRRGRACRELCGPRQGGCESRGSRARRGAPAPHHGGHDAPHVRRPPARALGD